MRRMSRTNRELKTMLTNLQLLRRSGAAGLCAGTTLLLFLSAASADTAGAMQGYRVALADAMRAETVAFNDTEFTKNLAIAAGINLTETGEAAPDLIGNTPIEAIDTQNELDAETALSR